MWTVPYRCLWDAPPDMVTMESLKAFYSKNASYEKFRDIENLFQRTLEIEDASLDDMTYELNELCERDCSEVPHIRAIYDYLDKSEASKSDLRYDS